MFGAGRFSDARFLIVCVLDRFGREFMKAGVSGNDYPGLCVVDGI
jgi:hypothetical protein